MERNKIIDDNKMLQPVRPDLCNSIDPVDLLSLDDSNTVDELVAMFYYILKLTSNIDD